MHSIDHSTPLISGAKLTNYNLDGRLSLNTAPSSPTMNGNHAIDIPDDLIQPSCEDKTVSCSKNFLTLGGGTALGAATIYLGVTTGLGVLPIVTLSCSVGFFTLKAIDSRCGRGSRTAEIFENGLKKNAAQLQQQQGIIGDEKREVNAIKSLGDQDITAINAVATINQAGIADTVKFEQTVSNFQQGVAAMKPTQDQLENDLKASAEQNLILQQRIDTYTSLFNQLHIQVQKAAETTPELQKIDLTWNAATRSFEQNSSKITEGFSQILIQMNGHLDLNQTLSNTITKLQVELKAIQELANQKEDAYKLLANENVRLNDLVNQQITSIENLQKIWDEENQSLLERKNLFLQEKAKFEALSNSINTAIETRSNSSNLTQLQELIRANKALVENQKKNLEDK